MNYFITRIAAIATIFFLAGCNSGGSPADAPTDVTVTPGDGIVTVTWTMQPGVDYWLFSAAASSITTGTSGNWGSSPEARVIISATSPQIVTGLTNGTTYSFTINGRTDGGPAGPDSISISAVPRLAGATWNTAVSAGTADLHGVAYGTTFVAAGSGGSLFSSADGMAWTALASGISSNLNAAVYGNATYLAAGAGGMVLLSTDTVAWTQPASGTSSDLHALAYSGSLFLAAGANGTIITSYDGLNWTVASSGTSSHLYGITYGNGLYVAVGASGTLLTSADGATWQVVASPTAAELKGVAYGAGTFVALGAGGTLITSADGITWTLQSPIASGPAINAVIYGTQFIAVGDGGAIYTSTDGMSWATPSSVTPASSNNLYAVTRGNYGYSTVGAAGSNLTAY